LTPLLASNHEAILGFARHDLLDEAISIRDLWQLPDPQKILRNQRPDGSWKSARPQGNVQSQENHDQYETFRALSVLVEMFASTKKHPAIVKAAEYLFTKQSKEGDFRGIYGNQYSPNYSAALAELLIKAGYANDPHIEKLFYWLLSMRQNDGGWAIPFRTKGYRINVATDDSETIQPDASKPFSYMVTGAVLRAFAAHPKHRKSKEALQAGNLLVSRIFKRDNYPDRASADYWLRFSFPFDYTHLISALDSLSLLGFSAAEPPIQEALEWFIVNQQKDGLWKFRIVRGTNRNVLQLWLTLAACRVFKRFCN
jgi:hypothetical protein